MPVYTLATDKDDAKWRFNRGYVFSSYREMVSLVHTMNISHKLNGFKVYRLNKRVRKENDRIKHD